MPAAIDAQISALFELGRDQGAPARLRCRSRESLPLDYNYEPHGTVNRGEMAAFITRALAHTSAPSCGNLCAGRWHRSGCVGARRGTSNRIPVWWWMRSSPTPTASVWLSRPTGPAGEVEDFTGFGDHECEVEGSDLVTGGDGDARVALSAATGHPFTGGTTVWAWTGDVGDTVDSDTELYRLDISESDAPNPADGVNITSEHPAGIGTGKKAHQGSSVLYTVQLQDSNGKSTSAGETVADGPAQFLVTLSTHIFLGVGAAGADGTGFATACGSCDTSAAYH